MAGGAASSFPTEHEDLSGPIISDKCQDVLLRLVSLEPRELCSEAIVEKCRVIRDLRSCGRIVEYTLISCNHASVCAECCHRCEVCPICRAPIRRQGPTMKKRLFEECCEVGLISSRIGDWRERNEHPHQDVQRLWAFFDVALENKLVSVICHYVLDVCMDESAVSNNATVSLLLDGTVVKDWCKKTLVQTIWSLRDIYSLGTAQMRCKVAGIERLGTRLHGLSHVLDSLERPNVDSTSLPFIELEELMEGTQRVSQHLDVMCWCARHNFLEELESSHLSVSDWKYAVKLRKQSASDRGWPQFTKNTTKEISSYTSTLFIEDAMWNIGYGKDVDNSFLWENLELQCLRQASPSSSSRKTECFTGGQANLLVPTSYPPESVREAVDTIFLETKSDLFLAKKAIFLYYLFDRHWPNHNHRFKEVLDDYAVTFDMSRHAMLESLVFFLLDEVNDLALEEACGLLPEVVSCDVHPKVARVLLERQKPFVALDVLRCSNREGSLKLSKTADRDELPDLQDVVTAMRVKLQCGLLMDAYLQQSAYVSQVKAQTLRLKSICGGSSEPRHWSHEMECLVEEICGFCIQKNLVAKMIELPWDKDEEKILSNFLLEQARRDPCASAGSLLVMFYIMRCRNQEAYLIHKQLLTIEGSFVAQCGDREKAELVKCICHQRSILVEKGVELLAQIQQDELRSGKRDQVLLSSTEDKETAFEPSDPNQRLSARLEMNDPTVSSHTSLDDSGQLLLASHIASTESRWGNYRQPTTRHGIPYRDTLTVFDDVSQPDVTNLGGNNTSQVYGGLSSPISGKKLFHNLENELSSPFLNRNMQPPNNKTNNERQRFLSSSDMTSVDSKGVLSVSSLEPRGSDLLEQGAMRAMNEKLQNGDSLEADNHLGTALPMSRWSENGAAERLESSRNGKMFDLLSKDRKYWSQREAPRISLNGKRKVHDHLDDYMQDATADDLISTSSLKMPGREQQKGILSSRSDIKNAYSRRKNGVRWRTEDDYIDLPPVSVSSGRINTFNGW